MKKMSIMFVAALCLATVGCKKKDGDGAASSAGSASGAGSASMTGGASASGGDGDCAKAIAHSLEVGKASLPTDEKLLAQMRDIGTKHCQDDKWSSEAVKCMTDAKTEADGQGCYGKLTPEQQDKMNKAVMDLQPTAGSAEPGSAAAPK